MARQIVLLRGINIGSKRRVAMPKLREALEDAGYKDVQTYVQSGNVVLSTSKSAKQTARAVEKLIKQHFRIDVPVVARTKGELASVVKGNPLESVAKDPKRYQVTFFEDCPGLQARPQARRAAPSRTSGSRTRAARSTPGIPRASRARRCGTSWRRLRVRHATGRRSRSSSSSLVVPPATM